MLREKIWVPHSLSRPFYIKFTAKRGHPQMEKTLQGKKISNYLLPSFPKNPI